MNHPGMPELQETLDQRGSAYGPFREQAAVAQELKAVIRGAWLSGITTLEPFEVEALDMLATKISRIVCGAPRQLDSWHDIAGYASITERDLRGLD